MCATKCSPKIWQGFGMIPNSQTAVSIAPCTPIKEKIICRNGIPPAPLKKTIICRNGIPPLAPLKKKIFGRDTEDFLNWKILNWRKQTLSTDKNIAEMPSSSDHRGFSTLLCVPNYFIDMTSILWPRHYTAD